MSQHEEDCSVCDGSGVEPGTEVWGREVGGGHSIWDGENCLECQGRGTIRLAQEDDEGEE